MVHTLIHAFIHFDSDSDESDSEDSDYFEMLETDEEDATTQPEKEKEEIVKNIPNLVPYDMKNIIDDTPWETVEPVHSKKRK
jgi:hypothetical protein